MSCPRAQALMGGGSQRPRGAPAQSLSPNAAACFHGSCKTSHSADVHQLPMSDLHHMLTEHHLLVLSVTSGTSVLSPAWLSCLHATQAVPLPVGSGQATGLHPSLQGHPSQGLLTASQHNAVLADMCILPDGTPASSEARPVSPSPGPALVFLTPHRPQHKPTPQPRPCSRSLPRCLAWPSLHSALLPRDCQPLSLPEDHAGNCVSPSSVS